MQKALIRTKDPRTLKPWSPFVSCKGDRWLKLSSVNSECKIIGRFEDHVVSLCMYAHARVLSLHLFLTHTENTIREKHTKWARQRPSVSKSAHHSSPPLSAFASMRGRCMAVFPRSHPLTPSLNCPDKNRWEGIILLVRSDISFLETFTVVRSRILPPPSMWCYMRPSLWEISCK